MGALLVVLAGIAASYGLDWLVTRVNDLKASRKGVSQIQLQSVLSSVMKRLSAENTNALNDLTDQLNSNPDTKALVNSRAIREISDRTKKAKQKMKELNKRAEKIQNTSNMVESYAYQPSSYKNSKMGVRDLSRIEQSVKELGGTIPDLAQSYVDDDMRVEQMMRNKGPLNVGRK